MTQFDTDKLTPRSIVQELDRHIIGQADAKRIVAIAMRNRLRRQRLTGRLRDEVQPKNIIMIGPTGVGKTEIARRLARLANAPLIKVEASKFTEVGYVGRDVESMIRDLVETAIKSLREREIETAKPEAERRARRTIINGVMSKQSGRASDGRRKFVAGYGGDAEPRVEEAHVAPPPSREELERKFDRGELDDDEIQIEIKEKPGFGGMMGMVGVDENMMGGLKDMMEKMMPPKVRSSQIKIGEARKILVDQELEEMLDMDKLQREGLAWAEQSGIVFLDEIDKIVARGGQGHGPDVSRQGVQRDLLPIVEGSTVSTKYGLIRTDHILFIAAGAFHESKPADLMPELQGRFPLRVELTSLTAADFKRILTEPECSLIDQYVALMKTDGALLDIAEEAIDEMAQAAAQINEQDEDIGARRLHTIMERVLQDVSFDAPDAARGEITIDRDYVKRRLEPLMKNRDLSRFIL